MLPNPRFTATGKTNNSAKQKAPARTLFVFAAENEIIYLNLCKTVDKKCL
jgi:hypothetical protein